jgi:hypothetical protein
VDPDFSTMVVSKDHLQDPDRGRRLRQEQALDLNPSIHSNVTMSVCLSWRCWCPATCL